MSETILRILATELTLLRVRCMDCTAMVEVSIDRHRRIFRGGYACPVCQAPFHGAKQSTTDWLAQVVAALDGLARDGKQVQVEFSITQQPPQPPGGAP